MYCCSYFYCVCKHLKTSVALPFFPCYVLMIRKMAPLKTLHFAFYLNNVTVNQKTFPWTSVINSYWCTYIFFPQIQQILYKVWAAIKNQHFYLNFLLLFDVYLEIEWKHSLHTQWDLCCTCIWERDFKGFCRSVARIFSFLTLNSFRQILQWKLW